MNLLGQTLRKISRLLNQNQIPYMVIGGVANLFHGVPRTTLDIDVTAKISDQALPRLIDAIGRQFKIRVKDPLTFAAQMNVLPLEDSETKTRIDLIVARLPYEFKAIERAGKEVIEGETVSICTPEDLIIHKIISDRLRDREDVKGIIQKQGSKLDRNYLDSIIRELAKALSRPDILQFYEQCFADS